jgi:hypothetical protein
MCRRGLARKETSAMSYGYRRALSSFIVGIISLAITLQLVFQEGTTGSHVVTPGKIVVSTASPSRFDELEE